MKWTRLEELRIKSNLSQQALANELGMSRQAYNNYELGKRQASHDVLLQLASFFSTSTDYLLGRTDDPTPIEIQKPIPSDEDELSPKVRELDEKLKAVGIDISKLDTDTVNDIVTLIKIAKGK